MGSPSGSTQSPSTAEVAVLPCATVVLLTRACTGGEFSPALRTVTVTIAVSDPPRPSVIV